MVSCAGLVDWHAQEVKPCRAESSLDEGTGFGGGVFTFFWGAKLGFVSYSKEKLRDERGEECGVVVCGEGVVCGEAGVAGAVLVVGKG